MLVCGELFSSVCPVLIEGMYLTCRIERLAEEDITSIADDHMILKPLNFSGHVTRLLSGWCKEIPAIDVGADLEALDVSEGMFNFQGNDKTLRTIVTSFVNSF